MTKVHMLETAEVDIAYDVHGPLPTADGRPPLFMIGQPMDASGFGTGSSFAGGSQWARLAPTMPSQRFRYTLDGSEPTSRSPPLRRDRSPPAADPPTATTGTKPPPARRRAGNPRPTR